VKLWIRLLGPTHSIFFRQFAIDDIELHIV